MRKVTKRVCQAFLDGKVAASANTSTNGTILLLHSNKIAWKDDGHVDGNIIVTLAGYPTKTTRERLNGLCELIDGTRPFYQKDDRQYYNDREIGLLEYISITPIMKSDIQERIRKQMRDALSKLPKQMELPLPFTGNYGEVK